MICGFTKAINKQKLTCNIFAEQLAEVIVRAKGGRKNPSE